MLKLKISDYDYKYLADQLDDLKPIQFSASYDGALHYPEDIELTESLEERLTNLCVIIGPQKVIEIEWWQNQRRLCCCVRDAFSRSYYSEVFIEVETQKCLN